MLDRVKKPTYRLEFKLMILGQTVFREMLFTMSEAKTQATDGLLLLVQSRLR